MEQQLGNHRLPVKAAYCQTHKAILLVYQDLTDFSSTTVTLMIC